MDNRTENVYLCDPSKNKGCAKTSCFLKYGECKYTIKRQCAVTNEEGKPLGYTWTQFRARSPWYNGAGSFPPHPIDDIIDTLEHNISGLVDE